jgi:hypothetical protein
MESRASEESAQGRRRRVVGREQWNGDLIFVHQDELKRFPAAVNPLFQGTVERQLQFSVVIPAAGDYFVIFDNRRGKEAQKVRILIRAERPRSPDPMPPSPGAKRKNDTEL